MNPPRTQLARTGLGLLALLMTALLAAEWISRSWLGLGTPPLYEPDTRFEYRLRPDQDVQRFGNRVQVNRWGMRSPDFEAGKTQASELRVMVFGDSVVNGGSQIDQSELSTTLLQADLQNRLNRPVTVGNISAGSWGPGNWLAYAQRFGFFDADVVVLVLGSGDHADNPVFAPLSANQPWETPRFALQEAVQRYLPRYLPASMRSLLQEPTAAKPAAGSPTEADRARGLADLQQFLRMAQGEGRSVAVVHHPDRDELQSGQYLDGHAQIRTLVQGLPLPWVELRPPFLAAGPGLYRDNIHHSARGQAVMAQALTQAVLPALARDLVEPLAIAKQEAAR